MGEKPSLLSVFTPLYQVGMTGEKLLGKYGRGSPPSPATSTRGQNDPATRGWTERLEGMISFVVPAYNEEELLGATLDAIHSAAVATGQDYEIVVADDASSDRTPPRWPARDARVVSASHRPNRGDPERRGPGGEG